MDVYNKLLLELSLFLQASLQLVYLEIIDRLTTFLHHLFVRFMKKEKFDFFGSPHPRNFAIANIRQTKLPEPEDHENLFNTPANFKTLHSPISIDPFFSCSPKRERRRRSEDFLLGESHSVRCEEVEEDSQQIHEKVNFSEEEQELLLPITPRKGETIIAVNPDQDPTIKKEEKPNVYLASTAQSRMNERGLKKLAYEAFKFVSSERKTTYKEVAAQLIKHLNDEQDMEGEKKEMNIKRRVYDALNVLIALGLLRRCGNKIIGKKCDPEAILLERLSDHDKCLTKLEMSSKKEELLLEELKNLRARYRNKSEKMKEKKQIQKNFKDRLFKVKQLTARNRQSQSQNPQSQLPKHHINFPLLMICRVESGLPIKEEVSEVNCLIVEQENDHTLTSTFRSQSAIDIIGDLDILNILNFENIILEEPHKRQKFQKRRKPNKLELM